ncbi:MAG: hypothetical protein HUU46_18340 [Candidatus Hydrogenedentes bacterium]|nr:hypothetical protein [Candidatus Hydrogenedentota bacterium]
MRSFVANRAGIPLYRVCSSFPLAFLLALSACRPADRAPGGEGTPSGPPSTAAVLKLMPEGAVTALALPSVELAEEQIHALLLRGAPDDVDMRAEIKVLTGQFARGANAFEAESIADIAAIKGLDPEKPLALFFGASKEIKTEPSPLGQIEFERQIMAYLGFGALPPMAAVLPYAKRQDAEKFVVDWGGSGTMNPKDLDEPKTTIFSRDDDSFAYFFTDDLLVAGTSAALVRGIAGRMKSPASVRYGTNDCPADSTDEIVQLIRTDKVAAGVAASTSPFFSGSLPRNLGDAASQLWRGWIEPYKGDDPMVVTWKFDGDRLSVRSRLDYAKHPEAKAALAPAAPLTHLNALPESTIAAWSIQLTPKTRASLKESAGTSMGAQGGMIGQLGGSIGKVIDLMGDAATIAVTGPGADTSKLAVLISFQDGDAARSVLRDLGMTPLKAETYNNTDIFSFVFPPATVYYAIPKSTFVLAGNLDSVKDLIDRIDSGKPGPFASGLNPPLDVNPPRQQAFVAKQEFFAGALLPALEANGMASKDQTQYTTKALGKVRDARMTTEVVKDWQDTHLVVQFE